MGPRSIPGMNVVFVEPFFPSSQRNFPRALAEAGRDGDRYRRVPPRRDG